MNLVYLFSNWPSVIVYFATDSFYLLSVYIIIFIYFCHTLTNLFFDGIYPAIDRVKIILHLLFHTFLALADFFIHKPFELLNFLLIFLLNSVGIIAYFINFVVDCSFKLSDIFRRSLNKSIKSINFSIHMVKSIL